MSNATLDTLRTRLEMDPVEEVVHAVKAVREALEASVPEELAEFEDELCVRIAEKSHGPWIDRAKAAQAFLYYLDVTVAQGREDGDTRTWSLIRALEQDPRNDETLLEYVRAVADTNYRYTDLALGEIAAQVTDPARARWLGALDTLTEYFCLRDYLDPPKQTYVDAMKRSFGIARQFGVDEAYWQKARQWLLGKVPFASVPADLFARYAQR